MKNRKMVKCSVHLQGRLADLAGFAESGDPLSRTAPDDPHTKKTVIVIGGEADPELSVNPPPGDKAARDFEQTTEPPSDTSENRIEHAKEFGRLDEKRSLRNDRGGKHR